RRTTAGGGDGADDQHLRLGHLRAPDRRGSARGALGGLVGLEAAGAEDWRRGAARALATGGAALRPPGAHLVERRRALGPRRRARARALPARAPGPRRLQGRAAHRRRRGALALQEVRRELRVARGPIAPASRLVRGALRRTPAGVAVGHGAVLPDRECGKKKD